LKKDFTRKRRRGGALDYRWLGPYTIVHSLGKGLYSIVDKTTGKVLDRVNGFHLKPFQCSEDSAHSQHDHQPDIPLDDRSLDDPHPEEDIPLDDRSLDDPHPEEDIPLDDQSLDDPHPEEDIPLDDRSLDDPHPEDIVLLDN
jgi:hypothetical protein